MDIRLLGGFGVAVDSHPIPEDAWPQRRAADLVKLLALADGHRLARDQVLEALWPQLATEPAAANLHKAASYARRALGDRSAVVLRAGQVQLAPGAEVMTDVERLEAGDGEVSADELLPDDRYEEWTLAPRERVRALRLAGLRRSGLWEDVLRADPADEEAGRELARSALAAGDRASAVRRLRSLRDELGRQGVRPSEETLAFEAQLASGPAVGASLLFDAPMVGRERELDFACSRLRKAAERNGGALLVTGAAGMGKSRFIDALMEYGERNGFHTLRGSARAEEGASPYAPFVEAVEPLVEERPDLPAGMSAGALSALALLVPSAAHGHGGATQAADRHLILSAAGQLIARAAHERPVLLVLDGLHAADDATVALVRYLARTARRACVALVVGARDEPIREPLARLR